MEVDAKMCCVCLPPPHERIAEVKTSITVAISSALGTRVKTPTFQGETRQSGGCAIAATVVSQPGSFKHPGKAEEQEGGAGKGRLGTQAGLARLVFGGSLALLSGGVIVLR